MTDKGRGVNSVEVGAGLLEILAAQDAALMLRDLARLAGLSPAQAHAYLISLAALGLVEQEAGSARYRLGPTALDFGITRMRSVDPIRLGQAAAIGLSEETQLAVALVVWGGFGATVVQVLEGPDQVHINTRAGTVYSLTGTASGRIFAAYLPESLVKAAIRRERDEKAGSGRVGRLMDLSAADLSMIRQAGYATVDPTPVPGVNALSVPVLDHAGQIQMALTLIGAARSLDTSPGSPHLRLLQETALRVSRGLGFAGQALSLPD